jgi:tetratricopeptide (TPR) repeat protein
MDPVLQPSAEAVALLEEKGVEATRLFNEKKYPEAEALAIKLLELAPEQRLALRVLFEIRKAQGRKPATEALARRLAALPGPGATISAANLQLAQIFIGDGRYAEALAPAEAALIATPRDPSAQHVLGVALTETGSLPAGERHYRRALQFLGREDGLVLANLAWNLKLQGRLDEAAAVYERALALRADNKRAVGGFAQVQMARGLWPQAAALLNSALAQWPDERTLRLLLVLTEIHLGAPQAALARFTEPVENLLASEMIARGLALARLNEPVEAVKSYALAKKFQRERQGLNYDPAPFIAQANTYKEYFKSERFAPLPRAGAAPARQPVFILGFPRSGSALLEQLLALVPGFSASDEALPVGSLVSQLPGLTGSAKPYPELLDRLLVDDSEVILGQLRAKYFNARARLAGPFITDRAVSNMWHLGLIKLLFPEAPVIHVLRHPLDVMLSNLSQDRKLEGNAGTSMAATARHYDTMMGMVKHYRAQLTLRYLPLRYEDLVTAPGKSLARVHIIVREPLHDRGLFRFREYRAQMPGLFGEVRDLLLPWISELGYGDGS